MIDGNSVLAIVPARSGSKGLPLKNIMNLNGRPLLAWPILAAKESKYIDEILVSTDNEDFADIARNEGANVPFLRPDYLATDEASSIDVVMHGIEFCKMQYASNYDYVVLLEPTSPLTEAKDIDSALEELLNKRNYADSIVGVSLVESAHPVFDVRIDQMGRIIPYHASDFSLAGRRQEIEELFFLDGSLYISDIAMLIKNKSFYHERTLAYVVPKWKSFEIDSLIDFICVEAIMQKIDCLRKDGKS